MGRQARYPCTFKCQFGTGPGVQGATIISLDTFGGLAHLAGLVPGDTLLNFSFTAQGGSDNTSISVAVDDTTVGQLASFEIIDSLGGFFSIVVFKQAFQAQIVVTEFIFFDFNLPNPDPAQQSNPGMQGAWRVTNAP